jgi:hypothetical protein
MSKDFWAGRPMHLRPIPLARALTRYPASEWSTASVEDDGIRVCAIPDMADAHESFAEIGDSLDNNDTLGRSRNKRDAFMQSSHRTHDASQARSVESSDYEPPIPVVTADRVLGRRTDDSRWETRRQSSTPPSPPPATAWPNAEPLKEKGRKPHLGLLQAWEKQRATSKLDFATKRLAEKYTIGEIRQVFQGEDEHDEDDDILLFHVSIVAGEAYTIMLYSTACLRALSECGYPYYVDVSLSYSPYKPC